MRSLQERFNAAITVAKRLDSEPSIEAVDTLRRILADLDHELRTTSYEPAERYELTKLSDHAHSVLADAHARARTALDIAEAARQREIHALEHPTVLDPDPPRRSALAGYTTPTLDGRSSVFDGFDR